MALAVTITDSSQSNDTPSTDNSVSLVSSGGPSVSSELKSSVADVGGAVSDWVDMSGEALDSVWLKFLDFAFTGGPGGYGGSGAGHAPISEGVSDVPELNVPEIAVKKILNTLSGVKNIPSLIEGVTDSIFYPISHGFLSAFGFKTMGAKAKVKRGAPLPGAMQSKARRIQADGKVDLKALEITEEGGRFYFAYSAPIEQMLYTLGQGLTLLLGGGIAGSAVKAGLSFSKIWKFIRQFGVKNIKGVFGKFKAWAKNGFKSSKKTTKHYTGIPRKFSKKEIDQIAKSFGGKVKSPPSGSMIGQAASKLGKPTMARLQQLGGKTLKEGAFMVAEYTANKLVVRQLILSTDNGKKLSEEDLNALVEWHAVSMLFSRLGAKAVSSITGKGMLVSFVASEIIQYLGFTASGGGGDTTFSKFIQDLAGYEKPVTKNRGGLIAI